MDIDVNIQETLLMFLEWSNQIADFSIPFQIMEIYYENKIIEKYDGEASIMLFNLKN